MSDLLSKRRAAAAAGVLVLLALPFYADGFWLQSGLFAMAAVLGAIGLGLLTGTAGQLSLGHSFFLAVGAYGYVWLSGGSGGSGSGRLGGLGLPPVLAFVLAVALAGGAGGLFSPIAGRLRGMYLGVATIALVFLGQHVMVNSRSVTGGFNGRAVEPMALFGFSFSDSSPRGLAVLGVPFGGVERLWYFGLALVAIGLYTARNLHRGRQGRALAALRDSGTAAAVMGVPVARYRCAAFVVSCLYAGAAGALTALVFKRVVPDHFGLALSIDYLAMIVIGGLGSVGGAAAAAVLVSLLPQVLTVYADRLPLIAPAGTDGFGATPGEAARYLYGAAIVLILTLAPGGLAGLVRRGRPPAAPTAAPAAPIPVPVSRTATHPSHGKEPTP
ncbi:branched-chain amino acid ABC transporter permease [Kitasatospora sp. NPDC051914]|uniref:branched-chain amino acid ABC transporter permease n=1 Tax=Kitasatospora sp. NPDC051914 TaxID=3154945 RepID=UPI00344817AD